MSEDVTANEPTSRVPVTLCWHCDRALDAATDYDNAGARPEPGAISLCLYCGAVAVFGPDLALQPPSKALLDELGDDRDFRSSYTQFSWARQYVMINDSLMRDRQDPDR